MKINITETWNKILKDMEIKWKELPEFIQDMEKEVARENAESLKQQPVKEIFWW
jgi:hypothetical protein